MPASALKSAAGRAPFRVRDYPFFYMHWIIIQNNQNIGDALRERGITPTVWRILAILQDRGSMSIGELADASLIDRAFLSRLLSDLDRKKLVQKGTHRTDKRFAQIGLTSAGQELFLEILPLAKAQIQSALEGLNTREISQLKQTLSAIIRNLNQPTPLCDSKRPIQGKRRD